MKFLLKLSYNGSNYNGWQRQDNAISIQQTIENVLNILMGKKVEVVGCGRTDTGVHALCYYAHFINDSHPEVTFVYKLNAMLPPDIAIAYCRETDEDYHARFSAKTREYKYFIHDHKDPFLINRSWFFHQPLDLDAMNRACTILMEYDDFASFCKKGADNKTTLCKIYHAQWIKEENRLVFIIRADRFLRNMVRAIVGTMVEIGLHKLDMHEFRLVIEGRDRGNSGASVPACGLYLTDVTY